MATMQLVALADIYPPRPTHVRPKPTAIILGRNPRRRQFDVVDGHGAFFAAREAGLTHVSAYVRGELLADPLERLKQHRAIEDLTPLEEAAAIQEAMDLYGLGQRQLSRVTGLTQPQLSKRLSLLLLSPREKSLLNRHAITLEAAYKIAQARRLAAH